MWPCGFVFIVAFIAARNAGTPARLNIGVQIVDHAV
jgi:hypothetical protein